MYSIEKLEKILNEKVYSIEETSYGVTNNNYIVTTDKNKYFYRTSKDSTNIWKTVGVSTDVIKASWFALSDSFEFKLQKIKWFYFFKAFVI